MVTSFRLDKWIGETPHCQSFLRLFSMSTQGNHSITDMGVSEEGGWRWVFLWLRRMFVWEEEMLHNHMMQLGTMSLMDSEDMWRWVLESEGKFTAKSTYEFVSALNGPRTILHQVE